jgi:hypothetical protein
VYRNYNHRTYLDTNMLQLATCINIIYLETPSCVEFSREPRLDDNLERELARGR